MNGGGGGRGRPEPTFLSYSVINTYSMKGYCIIYFEHRNDVTSIVKLCLENTKPRAMLVTSFLCSK